MTWPYALVGFLIVVIVPAASGAATYLLLRRGRPAQWVCSKCGYDVSGLHALRCPECGSDISSIGMSCRGDRVSCLAGVANGIWILSIGALVVTQWDRLEQHLPHTETLSVRAELDEPRSGLYPEVVVEGKIRSRSGWGGRPPQVVTAEWSAAFAGPGGRTTISVDRSGSAILRQENGAKEAQRDAFDAHWAAGWFASTWRSSRETELHREMAAIQIVGRHWSDGDVLGWQDELWIRGTGNPFAQLRGNVESKSIRIASIGIATLLLMLAVVTLGVPALVYHIARRRLRATQ